MPEFSLASDCSWRARISGPFHFLHGQSSCNLEYQDVSRYPNNMTVSSEALDLPKAAVHRASESPGSLGRGMDTETRPDGATSSTIGRYIDNACQY